MVQLYLINKYIEFWPLEHRLSHRENALLSHKLNAPVSRCLQLLLEKRPELVMQKDFYQYVWGEQGVGVSINALYQNITLLRKGLRSLDSQLDAAIITVPKKGFKWDERISVESFSENEIQLVPEPPLILATAENKIPVSVVSHPSFKYFSTANLAVFTGVIITACIISISQVGFPSLYDNYFKDYTVKTNAGGCSYFSVNQMGVEVMVNNLKNENLPDCQAFPYRYLTFDQPHSPNSLIVCDRPMQSNPHPTCTAYIQYGSSTP
ncbi:hypothetical protein FH968_14800 [Buttiauxella sp. B2]|uniref:winged helix-turn-helix domain-containing protein n=1 Tax=Buttiauxella sp. B2 TaxID=2587812 RepID=UPI0011217F6A|nr:winged helix-turn-helix domain-containing protein [Buttiauxella sp. B2]TNV19480.1 hypothetical protein FH968_14800 [Buttiauxella sp. B2]